MKDLYYYFDFQSPYSYLSFSWVKKNKVLFDHLKINLIIRPVFLGAIIKHYETKGPAEITPKRNYLFKNCLREAKNSSIVFNPPKTLPFNSLYALRIVEGAEEKDKLNLMELIFNSGWGKGEEIGESDALEALLLNNTYSKNLIEYCTSAVIRKRMKENFKEAISKGVFGVPSFFIENELFWGNDSIKHLEDFIRGADNLDLIKYQYFLDNYFTD